MEGRPLNIQILAGVFAIVTAAAAAWLLVRLWRRLPARLDARRDAEVAERLRLMAALADAMSTADEAQRARLTANYRSHRAAVQALKPSADIGAMDREFQPGTPPRRLAA